MKEKLQTVLLILLMFAFCMAAWVMLGYQVWKLLD